MVYWAVLGKALQTGMPSQCFFSACTTLNMYSSRSPSPNRNHSTASGAAQSDSSQRPDAAEQALPPLSPSLRWLAFTPSIPVPYSSFTPSLTAAPKPGPTHFIVSWPSGSSLFPCSGCRGTTPTLQPYHQGQTASPCKAQGHRCRAGSLFGRHTTLPCCPYPACHAWTCTVATSAAKPPAAMALPIRHCPMRVPSPAQSIFTAE